MMISSRLPVLALLGVLLAPVVAFRPSLHHHGRMMKMQAEVSRMITENLGKEEGVMGQLKPDG